MNNVAIILKQIDLLDAWDVIDTQTLKGRLKPFVVSCGRLVHGLLLPADGALATSSNLRLKFFELFWVPTKQKR